MARDYKSRAQSRGTRSKNQSVAWWKWLLTVLLLAGFIWFLISLSDSTVKPAAEQYTKPLVKKAVKKTAAKPTSLQQKKASKIPEPEFDFYQILENKEVIVPEYETKTIAREERIGKAKSASYIMQAGAFKDFRQADKLRAQLALLGIESKVEKVGTWNRVKIGPYPKMTSVNRVAARLKKNGISVIVTKIGG